MQVPVTLRCTVCIEVLFALKSFAVLRSLISHLEHAYEKVSFLADFKLKLSVAGLQRATFMTPRVTLQIHYSCICQTEIIINHKFLQGEKVCKVKICTVKG